MYAGVGVVCSNCFLTGNQQYVIQQQQLPHGQIIVSGSQPGLVTTPPSVMVMQGAQGPMYPHMQVAGVMAQGQGTCVHVFMDVMMSSHMCAHRGSGRGTEQNYPLHSATSQLATPFLNHTLS